MILNIICIRQANLSHQPYVWPEFCRHWFCQFCVSRSRALPSGKDKGKQSLSQVACPSFPDGRCWVRGWRAHKALWGPRGSSQSVSGCHLTITGSNWGMSWFTDAQRGDFPGPEVRNPLSSAGDTSPTRGRGTKTPCAWEQITRCNHWDCTLQRRPTAALNKW